MDAENVFNQLWVEKYRPKTIKDVVLTTEQLQFFEKCLYTQDIPHMLFYGPPGSGKTTTARIFIKNLIHSNMDILFLNGSDTNGVDFIRNTVIEFAKTPPMSSKFKIVFIDESDYLTTNSMAILRNAMETYAGNVRFIFTCNYVGKIIDPIQSRCAMFEMKPMSFEFVKTFVKKILNSEKIEYVDNDLDGVIKGLMPDIRKIINLLQRKCINGKLAHINADEMVSVENKIVGLVVELCDSISTNNVQTTTNKVVPTLLDIIRNEQGLEIQKVYDILFTHDGIPSWGKIKVNEYANNNNSCFNQSYNFMAMVYDMLKTGMLFVKTFGISKI